MNNTRLILTFEAALERLNAAVRDDTAGWGALAALKDAERDLEAMGAWRDGCGDWHPPVLELPATLYVQYSDNPSALARVIYFPGAVFVTFGTLIADEFNPIATDYIRLKKNPELRGLCAGGKWDMEALEALLRFSGA